MARVNRELLLTQLETVQPGLSPRPIIQQSSCFIFRDDVVTTFNDEISCRHNCCLDIEAAVTAEPLLALLRKLKEEEIDVTLEEGELLIKGKGRRSAIRTDIEIVLPIDKVEKPKKWKPLPAQFVDALIIVQECASSDQSQFTLTCIHLHPKWIEACDNMQVSRYKIKTGVKESVLLRRSSIKHVTVMDVSEFSETENWIHFRNSEGLIFSCRRFTESYLDVSGLLQVEDGENITLPKALGEAIERAEIFSADNAAERNEVLVELRPGKMRLKGQGVSGWYQETKKIKYTGKSMKFMISPKLLTELTTRHNEAEITSDRLKVDGGSFVYVTCLVPEGENE